MLLIAPESWPVAESTVITDDVVCLEARTVVEASSLAVFEIPSRPRALRFMALTHSCTPASTERMTPSKRRMAASSCSLRCRTISAVATSERNRSRSSMERCRSSTARAISPTSSGRATPPTPTRQSPFATAFTAEVICAKAFPTRRATIMAMMPTARMAMTPSHTSHWVRVAAWLSPMRTTSSRSS